MFGDIVFAPSVPIGAFSDFDQWWVLEMRNVHHTDRRSGKIVNLNVSNKCFWSTVELVGSLRLCVAPTPWQASLSVTLISTSIGEWNYSWAMHACELTSKVCTLCQEQKQPSLSRACVFIVWHGVKQETHCSGWQLCWLRRCGRALMVPDRLTALGQFSLRYVCVKSSKALKV